MSHTQHQAPVTDGTPLGAGGPRGQRKQHKLTPVLLQLAAMLGLGALLYPSAADWFSSMRHHSDVSGYVEEIQRLPEAVRSEELRAAEAYNSQMPRGVLRDPYTNTTGYDELAESIAYQSYLDVLYASDEGVIGELSYPSLGILLPIYHGTSNEVLTKGVGHLYGSSLPIGGPSTHSVMTSHSGLVHASLFTDLPDAEIGDIFTVRVLGEQHYYEVRNLETVLPHETDGLSIVEDEDWITLITCTPIGVNSHRLLVQAERIPAPPGEGERAIAADSAGFPWWAVVFIVGSLVVAYFIFAPPRQKKKQTGQEKDSLTLQKAEQE